MCADQFCKIDRQVSDSQKVYTQKHLMMRADDPDLQPTVSKLLQMLSISDQIILA